jgi:probable phosphoglycerate mutase
VSTTSVILVRHGESVVTVRQVVGGLGTCEGLSALGVRQAEALRDRLADDKPSIDALWSSTLPRAVQTAEIIAPVLGVDEIVTDAELVEQWHGEAEGLGFTEARRRYEFFDMRAEPDRTFAPGGESLRRFHDRVAAALARMVDGHAGQTVLVVCHGGVIDVAFRTFLRLGLQSPFNLWTVNTSLSEFVVPNGGEHVGLPDGADIASVSAPVPVLRRYNDAAHLIGLPARTPVAS